MSGAPYFFFELILSRSIFSSVSWYLLDFLLCIIFQGKTATTWPFSSGTANWFFYSEGNTNREKKTSSGRQNGDGNCHRYQSFSNKIFVPVMKFVVFMGAFVPESRIAVGKTLISTLLWKCGFFELPASQSINRSLEWVHLVARQNGNRWLETFLANMFLFWANKLLI